MNNDLMNKLLHMPSIIGCIFAILLTSISANGNPSPEKNSEEWLKEAVARQLEGCRVESTSGTVLHTPDGIGHYKALWTRDYYYMVKYAGEFMDTDEIKASIEFILAGQRADGCIPDRVNAEEKAIYSPGGEDKPMADHALDNGPFLALVACEYVRITGNLDFFRKIEPALKKGLDQIHRSKKGLVYNPPEEPQCVYGFTDIVTKTGHLLFSSLLYYQACLEMEKLCLLSDCGDPSDYLQRANLSSGNIDLLWDDKEGMYLAADVDCRQIDIWGSAFAVDVGITSKVQSKRISDYYIKHKDAVFQRGQVRHLPGGELWKRMFRDSYKPGTYQNGAFWATPLPWIVGALLENEKALAKQLVDETIEDFQKNGIAECVNGTYSKVPNFVVSITNLYAAYSLVYE